MGTGRSRYHLVLVEWCQPGHTRLLGLWCGRALVATLAAFVGFITSTSRLSLQSAQRKVTYLDSQRTQGIFSWISGVIGAGDNTNRPVGITCATATVPIIVKGHRLGERVSGVAVRNVREYENLG